jgi:D-arabinose 1-dehydrogenase-like Zn-dependent alcohol dehydrogenase
VPDPEPGPGQVLLEVSAAGVCHSDIAMDEAPPAYQRWHEGKITWRAVILPNGWAEGRDQPPMWPKVWIL